MFIKHILFLIYFILYSCLAFSMNKLNDSDLDNISAKSGVGIFIDHVYIYSNLDQKSIIDRDGLAGDDGASLNINNIESDVIRFEALARGGQVIYDTEEQHIQWNALFSVDESQYVDDFIPAILTIDMIDKLPSMSAMNNYKLFGDITEDKGNMVGIFLGLPTIEEYTDDYNIGSITITPLNNNIININKSLGHLYITQSQIDLLGGRIEIAPHEGYGVSLVTDDILFYSKIPTMIYFDEDTTENSNNQFRINEFIVDALHINSIDYLGSNGKIHSMGYDLYVNNGNMPYLFNTRQIDNFDFYNESTFRPMEIDLSAYLPAISSQYGTDVGGILIGLPSAEYFIDSFKFKFTTGEEYDEWLGRLIFNGIDLAMLKGYLEVAPHNLYGMDIILDDVAYYFSIDKFGYEDIDDGGCIWFNNYEQDITRINALYKDNNGHIRSVGEDIHTNNLSNIEVENKFTPSPMKIDITSRLPKMSDHLGGNMGGISIHIPTVEIYTDKIGLESITLYSKYGAINNNAPLFTNIEIREAKNMILGGRIEVAPH